MSVFERLNGLKEAFKQSIKAGYLCRKSVNLNYE